MIGDRDWGINLMRGVEKTVRIQSCWRQKKKNLANLNNARFSNIKNTSLPTPDQTDIFSLTQQSNVLLADLMAAYYQKK